MDKTPVGGLRTLFILFVALLIGAGLTKAGLIPNRFDIEILSPNEETSLIFGREKTGELDGEDMDSKDGFFIIDMNDSNYPLGCNTPGLSNPEKCVLRTSTNYCIAPYQTESTQTRYEANSYCNSLNTLGLSRELPYAYAHEDNIYWLNLIDIKSKIYGLNADGSEKPGHYRAYPANPTFENCTLRGNCGNEYGSYKLSVRCVAPCGENPSGVKKVDNDELINWSDKMLYWDSYKDDPELSIVMKAMGLRSTACSRIFCQSVADDGTYRNQKHYYWNKKDGKMTLIPNVYYVGRNDCAKYAELYEGKTNVQEKVKVQEKEKRDQGWNEPVEPVVIAEIKGNNNTGTICPKGYTYGIYSNTIKGYANIGYPPNRNRENYEQNFENWKKDLKNKEVQEITFGPFEGCIPDNGKLETCTEADTYDYTFCTINMIPLNNKCPEGYSFVKAGVAGPYDLCQGNKDKIVDSGGYIHTDQIPLQDDCTFFVGMGILPADGHCDVKKFDDKN